MTEEQALQLLEGSGALLTGHFKLSSGLHSARYLQCALALQHPRVAEQLGAALGQAWKASPARHERRESTNSRELTLVVSPALGGLIIGHEVGRALDVRACFAERVEGQMTLRRGFDIVSGEALLLVEDVVTTGKSTLETAAAVRELGGEPVAVACIANRSGSPTLAGLPLVSLVQLDIPTFDPDDCPMCQAGDPLVKPGSRPGR